LKPEGHPPLKFYQLVIWRWLATITAYFFLSGAYSLISLAFQINFSGGNPVTSETAVTMISYGNPDAYGKGTWPIYWMLNFMGMVALGLACENVASMLIIFLKRDNMLTTSQCLLDNLGLVFGSSS
jgi:hypothetical protein